jgi:hypothetical protein
MYIPAPFGAGSPPDGDCGAGESGAIWALAGVAKHFTSCIVPLAVCRTPPQAGCDALRRFNLGPDTVSAHIADDRAGLFWQIHLIAPGLCRMGLQ